MKKVISNFRLGHIRNMRAQLDDGDLTACACKFEGEEYT